MKQWYVTVFVCYHISYIRFTVSSFMLWPSSDCLIFKTQQVIMCSHIGTTISKLNH